MAHVHCRHVPVAGSPGARSVTVLALLLGAACVWLPSPWDVRGLVVCVLIGGLGEALALQEGNTHDKRDKRKRE